MSLLNLPDSSRKQPIGAMACNASFRNFAVDRIATINFAIFETMLATIRTLLQNGMQN
jgi:hypothetical protein